MSSSGLSRAIQDLVSYFINDTANEVLHTTDKKKKSAGRGTGVASW